MKKCLTILISALGITLSGCISKPKDVVYRPPSLNLKVSMEGFNIKEMIKEDNKQVEFYSSMGIKVDNKQKKQFIIGDNLAGYFEGYTNSYSKGTGYLMGSKTIYKNFASYINSEIINRNISSISQTILPYGTVIEHKNGVKEEFALHSKNRSLSMRVTSKTPEVLGITPVLIGDVDNWSYTASETEVYLEGKNSVIVFTANQPFKLIMNKTSLYQENETVLKLDEHSFRGVFSSINRTKDLIIYMGFSDSIEKAKIKANELRESEAHSREKNRIYKMLNISSLKTNDLDYNKAVNWAKYSAYTMVVEEFGKGIWAGLPWFKDNWGRDTFIALPGTLLISGKFKEAKEVLNNFATFQNIGKAEINLTLDDPSIAIDLKRFLKKQGFKALKKGENYTVNLTSAYVTNPDLTSALLESILEEVPGTKGDFRIFRDESYGRVPNRVTSMDNMIYNTTDGTPWLIREIYEYIQYTGDLEYGKEIFPMVEIAMNGVIENFMDESGYMTHDDADTWMDARINGKQPWSSRGSRAVEIQALWFSMLEISSYLANLNKREDLSDKWTAIAEKLKENFNTDFWDDTNNILADRLREDDTADYRVRPNQLMVITIPLINTLSNSNTEKWIVKNSVTDLLYPYGIASLNEEDEYFHPYHENLRFHHKDAAYHNGTIWGWNAGLIVTGLTKYGYQNFSYELSKNLANQILTMGTLGSMSENLSAFPDKKGDIVLSGTYSQAWSVSEFARNAYQDYLGFTPKLINNTLEFNPSFPEIWNNLEAVLPFGSDESIIVTGTKTDNIWSFKLNLKSDIPRTLKWESLKIELNTGENTFSWTPDNKKSTEIIGELSFREADREKEFPMYIEKNTLQDLIKKGDYR